jgi:hypothetical protein
MFCEGLMGRGGSFWGFWSLGDRCLFKDVHSCAQGCALVYFTGGLRELLL